MNKWEKEVATSLLDSEEAAIKELERQYKRALRDIEEKIKLFQADISAIEDSLRQGGLDDRSREILKSQAQSKIYQKNYQQALKAQVGAILDKMHGDNYSTLDSYLKGCYETGYVGTMYNIARQGIPLVIPIDQRAAVKAVLTDSKLSTDLYEEIGVNVRKLKRTITHEVSRGIASSLSFAEIARNISQATRAPFSRAKTIARTEGHRIQQAATRDAQDVAKSKGADVVKQWDASLDGKTRPSHRRVDGEIRELNEKFSNGLEYPGDPSGDAEEVINCRCVSLTRARAALDEDELEELKKRAEYFGLDKTANFEDYQEKYLKTLEIPEYSSIISAEAKALPNRFKKYVPDAKRRLEIIENGIKSEKPIYADGLLGMLAQKLMPHKDYYDVVLHGAEYNLEYFGETIDVETLCAIIAQRTDYKKGTPIRLIACYAGAKENGVAQYVADKLHVNVLAPDKQGILTQRLNGKIEAYSGSEIGTRDGKFVLFKPKEGERNAESNEK